MFQIYLLGKSKTGGEYRNVNLEFCKIKRKKNRGA